MEQYDFDKVQQANMAWNVAEKHFGLMEDELKEMGLYGEAYQNVYYNLVANLGMMVATKCSEYTHEAIDAAAMIASSINRSVSHLLLDQYETEAEAETETACDKEPSQAVQNLMAENNYDIAEPIGNDCVLVGESFGNGDRNVGVYRNDGTVVIPVEWSSIEWMPHLQMFDAFGNAVADNLEAKIFAADGTELFSDYDIKMISDDSDFVVVTQNDKYGIIHISGEVVVPMEYDRLVPGETDLPDIFCLVRDSKEEYIDAHQIWTRRHIKEILLKDAGATLSKAEFKQRFSSVFHIILAYCMLILHSKSIEPNNPGWKARVAAWKGEVVRAASIIAGYTIAEGNSHRSRYRALMQELCDYEMLYGDHDDHIDWAKEIITKEGIGLTDKATNALDNRISERVWERLAWLIAHEDFTGIEKFVEDL